MPIAQSSSDTLHGLLGDLQSQAALEHVQLTAYMRSQYKVALSYVSLSTADPMVCVRRSQVGLRTLEVSVSMLTFGGGPVGAGGGAGLGGVTGPGCEGCPKGVGCP